MLDHTPGVPQRLGQRGERPRQAVPARLVGGLQRLARALLGLEQRAHPGHHLLGLDLVEAGQLFVAEEGIVGSRNRVGHHDMIPRATALILWLRDQP